MSTQNSNKLLEPSLVKEAFRESFVKLNPRYMVKNPVMFTVEIGTFIMAGVCVWIAVSPPSEGLGVAASQGSLAYNICVTAVLFFTGVVCQLCRSYCRSKR